MAEVIPYRFRLRGGTAAEWASANPVLLAREPGVESDTGAIKYGDGTRAWNSLPYSGRNVATVLQEADQAAAARDTALGVPAIKSQVDTLWSERAAGGGGTGSYNDTQLRADFASADTTTLNSAKSYTDTEVGKDRTRLTTLEGRPKSVVLTQSAYDALSPKDANTIYFIRS